MKDNSLRTGIKIWMLILLILTQSCNQECEDILCFTPPSPFLFELVDESSRENLFTNQTFDPKDILIINLDDQSHIDFSFIDEDEYNIVQINTIGWETETVNYAIQISSESIFELYVNAQRLSGTCCNYTEYKEIGIQNAAYELDKMTGVYKILIPQDSKLADDLAAY